MRKRKEKRKDRRQIVAIRYAIFHAPDMDSGSLAEAFMRLFINRSDTYAEQYSIDGGASYRRVEAPLTVEILKKHLSGEVTVGSYAIDPSNQSCKWICFDIDRAEVNLEDLKREADKLIAVMVKHGLPETAILREFSGSKGIHAWLFLNPPIPAVVAYHLGRNVANEAGVQCEVFPKQKELLSPFGNLVKLAYGIHRVTKERRLYDQKWEAVEPEYLLRLEPVIIDPKEVEEIKKRLLQTDKGWMDRVIDVGIPYVGDDPPCVAKYLSGLGMTIGHRRLVLHRLVSYFLRFRGVKDVEKVRGIIEEWNRYNQPPLSEGDLQKAFEGATQGPYNYGCGDEYWSKHCDVSICPLKKHQLPVLLGEFTQEEIDQAEELLKNPKMIEEFTNDSEKWIAKDKAMRRTSLRTYVSAFTDDPLNFALMGRDSIGKTYNAATIGSILNSPKVWFLGGLSPTALVYDYADYDRAKAAFVVDLHGVTLLFLDPPNPDTWAKLRPILSHDKDEIMFRITQKTGKGTLKTMRCIIRGWPAVIQCAAQTGYTGGEYSSRFLTGTPEISKEKTREGMRRSGQKWKKPKAFTFNVGRARIWSALYRLLQEEGPIHISIPYGDLLAEKMIVHGPETMRFFNMFGRLIKANAALHIRQRKRDQDGYLIAEPSDFEEVMEDFEEIAATSFYGVSGDALQLYNNIRGKIDLRYEDIEEAAREVFGDETREDTIRRLYIKRLVEAGYLTEKTDPSDKSRVIYDVSAKRTDVRVFEDKTALLQEIISLQGVPESPTPGTPIRVPPTRILSLEKEPKTGLFQGQLTPPTLPPAVATPPPPMANHIPEPKAPLRDLKQPLARFKCHLCPAQYSSKEQLEEHQAEKHQIEKRENTG